MKKHYSLKGKKSFSEVFKRGRRYRGAGLQFIILSSGNSDGIPAPLSNEKSTHPKIGIMVSRHFGKAHLRNKVKRRIRAVLQKLLPEICDGVRIVVRIFDEVKDLTFDQVCLEVSQVLKKAEVLCKDR